MRAIKFKTQVTPRGTLRLPRLELEEGTPVEVIVLVRDEEVEFADLLQASETSLDFWDNEIDDRIWNDA